jgi:DNA helicase HerA-like ATPase
LIAARVVTVFVVPAPTIKHMNHWLEKFLARLWNRTRSGHRQTIATRVLDLGIQISDGETNRRRVSIEQSRRAESVAVLGKTGSGKSFLAKYFTWQDITGGRGFFWFDLHGDALPYILSKIAEEEQVVNRDLSESTIVIDPSDPDFSVGMNPLEGHPGSNRFVQIAEFSQIMKQRWHLDSFGARTDELLRNTLFVLAESGFTLVEISLFLTNAAFRSTCLKNLSNAEVKQYFELRYEKVSEPMRAVMREPILNKVSAFTADPHFRHLVGTAHSTFSILEAMDKGYRVILNVNKGSLGEQATTLGSLFLTTVKNSLFARKNHDLFSIYCDEIQNFVSFGGELENILSQGRKFGGSVISINQFLEQHPPEMRAAILAVGTHIFFQLSSADAQLVATALDGGKPLAELLKNLPRRHIVVKTGHERWREAVVPRLDDPKVDPTDLYNRCRARWARKRTEIEEEIQRRQAAVSRSTNEALNEWE